MVVLIAETDKLLAAAISEVFEAAGYEAVAVADPIVAWDRLMEKPPDLLLTRIIFEVGQVPGTALGLRAFSAGIPVIYMSSTLERAEHATAAHGAILIKPFEPSTLLDVAETLLPRSKDRLSVCEAAHRSLTIASRNRADAHCFPAKSLRGSTYVHGQ